MRSKIYFLFALFLCIILQSTSVDISSRKDRKTNDKEDYLIDYDYDDKKDSYATDKTKHSRLNNDYSSGSTYRRNRYSPQGSSSNYRTRSRWSSPDDLYDTNDWPQYGFGLNNFVSGFGGPLPATPFETGAYLSNGPHCYPLLDPQYPMFSDICGAIPQARYSLPNSFGHIERWQIAQTLATILNPAADLNCIRNLRLLLCPLLFPPCPTKYEAPPVVPCQLFCRMVKTQCANPTLEFLPCDLLPPVSDLCPVSPTPYSSLLLSYGQPLPAAAPLLPIGPIAPAPPLAPAVPTAPVPTAGPVGSVVPTAGMLPSSPFSSILAQAFSQPGLAVPDMSLADRLSIRPSPLFPSMFPSSPYSPALTPPGMPPTNVPSPSLASLLSTLNPILNMDAYNFIESLPPILVDFPPMPFGQDYRSKSRYYPLTRSATEKAY